MKSISNFSWSVLFAILLLSFLGYQCSKTEKLTSQLQTSQQLAKALTDSVEYYIEKDGQEAAKKAVLVAKVSDLEKLNLTLNQKTLLQEVKSHKNTIAASTVKEVVVVRDTIRIAPEIKDSSLVYKYTSNQLALQATLSDSLLTVHSISLPNTKTVLFTQDKKGVYVTVKNSNPYFKTAQLDSYKVPENKSFWNSKTFKTALFIIGLGTGVIISK